jgi:hypothetical protein
LVLGLEILFEDEDFGFFVTGFLSFSACISIPFTDGFLFRVKLVLPSLSAKKYSLAAKRNRMTERFIVRREGKKQINHWINEMVCSSERISRVK